MNSSRLKKNKTCCFVILLINAILSYPSYSYSQELAQTPDVIDKINQLKAERVRLLSEIERIDEQIKEFSNTRVENSNEGFSGFIKNDKKIEIKESPDLKSKTIEIIPAKLSPKIIIKNMVKDFYLIDYNGKVGWVREIYVFADSKEAYAYFGCLKKKGVDDEVTRFKNEKKDMIVQYVKVEDIDSANGVDVKFGFYYLNESKNVKYFRFYVTPYNAVGDKVSSSIGNLVQATLSITGPIKASDNLIEPLWEAVWYNSQVRCIKLNKVEIIYTDQTTKSYDKNLNIVSSEYFDNDCRLEE
jgi:hypothetical protein